MERRSKSIVGTETQEYTTAGGKTQDCKPLDPTGVTKNVSNTIRYSSYEVNRDNIIAQTLEGYVLPLLPAVPLHIHNIHLKCKTIAWDTDYYSELRLPSYRQNIGKYQTLDVDNIPVNYVFYPNGTIDLYSKNSDNPFRLQTGEDCTNLITFFRRIKDNLPHQVTVPDIEYWEFTECDINRDIRISDLLHFASVKVQIKHMDHLFRIYIKKTGNGTFCRVEETKNFRTPAIEAINRIFNPYERIERQLSEIQHLLILRQTCNNNRDGGDIPNVRRRL
jgi:hypothetical protein